MNGRARCIGGCSEPVASKYDVLCATCKEVSEALTARKPDGTRVDQRPVQTIVDEIRNRVPSHWMAM